jgi:hypothetical protein
MQTFQRRLLIGPSVDPATGQPVAPEDPEMRFRLNASTEVRFKGAVTVHSHLAPQFRCGVIFAQCLLNIGSMFLDYSLNVH